MLTIGDAAPPEEVEGTWSWEDGLLKLEHDGDINIYDLYSCIVCDESWLCVALIGTVRDEKIDIGSFYVNTLIKKAGPDQQIHASTPNKTEPDNPDQP